MYVHRGRVVAQIYTTCIICNAYAMQPKIMQGLQAWPAQAARAGSACNGFSPSSPLRSSSVRPPSISPLTIFSSKAVQTASAKPRPRANLARSLFLGSNV